MNKDCYFSKKYYICISKIKFFILVFAVKKGTDSSFLWKATVRIACVKIDAESKNIDSYRCLNLKQYLRVYNSLKSQSAAVKGALKDQDQKATSSGKLFNKKLKYIIFVVKFEIL